MIPNSSSLTKSTIVWHKWGSHYELSGIISSAEKTMIINRIDGKKKKKIRNKK